VFTPRFLSLNNIYYLHYLHKKGFAMSKEVSVRLGNVNYVCAVSNGHHQWILDEPVEAGGGDTAYDPFDALLASAGSCSAITLRMYAQRKGWRVDDIEVKISMATVTEGGIKKTVFTRNVFVQGNLNSEQLLRLQQMVGACPVSRLLEGEIVFKTALAHAPGVHTTGIDDVQQPS
jgi:putative redox protein